MFLFDLLSYSLLSNWCILSTESRDMDNGSLQTFRMFEWTLTFTNLKYLLKHFQVFVIHLILQSDHRRLRWFTVCLLNKANTTWHRDGIGSITNPEQFFNNDTPRIQENIGHKKLQQRPRYHSWIISITWPIYASLLRLQTTRNFTCCLHSEFYKLLQSCLLNLEWVCPDKTTSSVWVTFI